MYARFCIVHNFLHITINEQEVIVGMGVSTVYVSIYFHLHVYLYLFILFVWIQCVNEIWKENVQALQRLLLVGGHHWSHK